MAPEDVIRRLQVARTTGRMPADLAEEITRLLQRPALAMPSDTMRQKDAARYLRVSVRTLREWEKQGIGPPRLIVGRTPLYAKAMIDDWIKRQSAAA